MRPVCHKHSSSTKAVKQVYLDAILFDRKSGIGSDLFWPKPKDNLFLGNTRLKQLLSNTRFCAVVLYPDFIIDEFDVYDTAVDMVVTAPADLHEDLAGPFIIKHDP